MVLLPVGLVTAHLLSDSNTQETSAKQSPMKINNLINLLQVSCALSLTIFQGAAAAPVVPTVSAPVTPDAARQTWMLGPFVKADSANPVLKPDINASFLDPMSQKPVAWEHDHTFNPAAVVRGNKIYLLFRAEDDSGTGIGGHTSRIGLAVSADGLHFTVSPSPVLFPANDDQKPYDWTGGCEDPRIVETADGGYILLYTSWDRGTARLSSASSRDLVHWTKHGPVFARTDGGRYLNKYCKSGAIVTRREGDHLVATKISGKYWMFFGEGMIYTATSTDLLNWEPTLNEKGDWKPLLTTREGHFDSDLTEAGPPAVMTRKGILLLYNGKASGGAYSGGEALMDLADPTKVIDRTDSPFIKPERPYEITGQYGAGTTFIEGLVHFHKRWFLYYGTADSFVAAASAPDLK